MIDAGFIFTVTDDYGDEVRISVPPSGNVSLEAPPDCRYLTFGPKRREAFTQAWAAACREADRRAGTPQGAAEPAAASPSGTVPASLSAGTL
jgi:hypothetical protein